jgi:hypothetical protein
MRVELVKPLVKRSPTAQNPAGEGGAISAYVVVHQILDPPPIPGWQLHHIPLQPPLRSIAGHGLARTGRRLVVSADPRRKALVWHLPRDVSIESSHQLVVKMLSFAIVRC